MKRRGKSKPQHRPAEALKRLREEKGWTREHIDGWIKAPKGSTGKWELGWAPMSEMYAVRLGKLFMCDADMFRDPETGEAL